MRIVPTLVLALLFLVTGNAAADLIYVADTNNNQPGFVLSVNPSTGGQTLVSSGNNFVDPWRLALEATGNLLVVDGTSILRVNPSTGGQAVVSSGGLLANAFGGPAGITVAGNGDIIAAAVTQGSGAIVRIDPNTGAQSVISSGGYLYDTFGVRVAANGDLIVGNDAFFSPDSILRINPSTGAQTIITQSPFRDSDFYNGIALDANGNIYVADARINGGSPGVLRVDPNTGAQTIISQGGQFMNPVDLAFTSNGNLLVLDDTAKSLFQVDLNNGSQTIISSGGSFVLPAGLAVAASVPEPGTLMLCGIGGLTLLGHTWRGRKRRAQVHSEA